MIGSGQPKTLTAFYERVLGKPADTTEGDGEWLGWKVGGTFLHVGPHSEVTGSARDPQRIIINMETADVKGEFARIQSLGAAVIKAPYAMEGMPDFWIATFADPDGNYFQLMSPWKNE
ncbi:MAG: VOC family protein [Patescibacteria group bacterium]